VVAWSVCAAASAADVEGEAVHAFVSDTLDIRLGTGGYAFGQSLTLDNQGVIEETAIGATRSIDVGVVKSFRLAGWRLRALLEAGYGEYTSTPFALLTFNRVDLRLGIGGAIWTPISLAEGYRVEVEAFPVIAYTRIDGEADDGSFTLSGSTISAGLRLQVAFTFPIGLQGYAGFHIQPQNIDLDGDVAGVSAELDVPLLRYVVGIGWRF